MNAKANFPQELLNDAISYLKRLQGKGIRSIYLSDGVRADRQVNRDVFEEETLLERTTKTKVDTELAKLSSEVASCTACALHEGRTNTVFGKGSATTKVMFIGEGPGREEDLRGEPFVGRSGQLLTKMLSAIELERDDVYITNMVKCRPPGNRDPQEDEVRCCERYLAAQIDLIRPKIVCALGRVAAHWLLDTNESLAELRNRDVSYRGTPVLVTYHPAALLRNPGLKRNAWEDFKRLRDIIEG